ncbi:MAG: hypothetical protein HKL84_02935 [Acidimicrobiaceae bacterium]|nr:hypothetical protein [Acidimicrobiaceae bacterium]
MSSRIEVELTSQKPDGLWTWRAAGAKEPRGTLDGSILYDGAKIGDVVRAEVVFEIDGIIVESVYAPKTKQSQSNLIELSSKEPVSYLTRTVSNRDRNRTGDDRKFPRNNKRPQPDRAGAEASLERSKRRSEGRTSPKRTETPRIPAAGDNLEKRPRQRRPERPSQPTQPAKAPAPKFKRLIPRNTHRARTLQDIAPEHLPIAEQLLKGGLPAVRQALAVQNEKAIAEGKPTISENVFLSIAEPMLPVLKLATWMDRAEVAIEIANEASLRDLRSVISAADLVRHDDSTREMLEKLKILTEQRAGTLCDAWLAEIRENLNAKRIIRAVRLSSRPPEPIAKLPGDLLEELTNAANEMMGPETPADRWSALLDALAQSPIRRQVIPKGLPENAPVQLVELAKESSGRIPALARLLGIAIPPPPRPRKKISQPGKIDNPETIAGGTQDSGQPESQQSVQPIPVETPSIEPSEQPADSGTDA